MVQILTIIATLWLAASPQVVVPVNLLTATVTDATGHLVPNLTKDDFVLEEDGVLQTISHFAFDQNMPISYGIVIDRSASMAYSLKTAVKAG